MKLEADSMGTEHIDWEQLLTSGNKISIIVNNNQFKGILEEINTNIDDEGFLINKETGSREKSNAENEMEFKKLGVLSAGSKVFIEKNIASFSEFLVSKNKN